MENGKSDFLIKKIKNKIADTNFLFCLPSLINNFEKKL